MMYGDEVISSANSEDEGDTRDRPNFLQSPDLVPNFAGVTTFCKQLAERADRDLAAKICIVRESRVDIQQQLNGYQADVLCAAIDIDDSFLITQRPPNSGSLSLQDFLAQNQRWFEYMVLMAAALNVKIIDVVANSTRTVDIASEVCNFEAKIKSYGRNFDGDTTKPLCTKVIIDKVSEHLRALVSSELQAGPDHTDSAAASARIGQAGVTVAANYFQLADLVNGRTSGESARLAWEKAKNPGFVITNDAKFAHPTHQKTAIMVAISHEQTRKYSGQNIFMVATDDKFDSNVSGAIYAERNYYANFTCKAAFQSLPIAALLPARCIIAPTFYAAVTWNENARMNTGLDIPKTCGRMQMPMRMRDGLLRELELASCQPAATAEVQAIKSKLPAENADINHQWITDHSKSMEACGILPGDFVPGYRVEQELSRHNAQLNSFVQGVMLETPESTVLRLCTGVARADAAALRVGKGNFLQLNPLTATTIQSIAQDTQNTQNTGSMPVSSKEVLKSIYNAILAHDFELSCWGSGLEIFYRDGDGKESWKGISRAASDILLAIRPLLVPVTASSKALFKNDISEDALSEALKAVSSALKDADKRSAGYGAGIFRYQPRSQSTRDLYKRLQDFVDASPRQSGADADRTAAVPTIFQR